MSSHVFQLFDSLKVDRKKRAFTLVELLSVITIIGLLAVAVVPAFNSLQKAGSVTNAAEDIGGVVGLSRTRARSQNTWLWIGLKPDGKGNVVARTFQSKDGTFNLSAQNIVRADKDITLANFNLAPSAGNSSPARPTADFAVPANGAWLCCSPSGEVKVSTTGGAVDFSTPNIPQQNALELKLFLEIRLVPATGNPNNVAVVQVAGLTGQAHTYRL